IMLQKLSEHIRACHERAVEARRKAETALDPGLKADFFEMEKRWLTLARSYAFTESLEEFRGAISSPRRKPSSRIRAGVAAFQSTVETDGVRDEMPELHHALRRCVSRNPTRLPVSNEQLKDGFGLSRTSMRCSPNRAGLEPS